MAARTYSCLALCLGLFPLTATAQEQPLSRATISFQEEIEKPRENAPATAAPAAAAPAAAAPPTAAPPTAAPPTATSSAPAPQRPAPQPSAAAPSAAQLSTAQAAAAPSAANEPTPSEEVFILFGGRRVCPYPPGTVWGSAEYLLWWTKGNQLPPLLTTSPAGTPVNVAGALGSSSVLFGNQSVNTDMRSGMRFNLGTWLNPTHTTGIEGSFFMLPTSATDYSAASAGLPILSRPFINLDPTDPNYGKNGALQIAYPGLVQGSFAASSTSSLLGSDVYLRQALGCGGGWRLDALAGFRYLRLREGLNISETETSTNPASPVFGLPFFINEGFNTTNNFYGGELGLIGEYIRNRWFIRAVGKVGLGSTQRNVNINGTTHVGNLVEEGGFLALPSNIGNYNSSAFSVVPEVGLNIGYAITPRIRIFTGYTFLYWTQVARPGDQVDLGVNKTQPPLGGALVGPARPLFNLNQSDFWAQGINFGLQIRY